MLDDDDVASQQPPTKKQSTVKEKDVVAKVSAATATSSSSSATEKKGKKPLFPVAGMRMHIIRNGDLMNDETTGLLVTKPEQVKWKWNEEKRIITFSKPNHFSLVQRRQRNLLFCFGWHDHHNETWRMLCWRGLKKFLCVHNKGRVHHHCVWWRSRRFHGDQSTRRYGHQFLLAHSWLEKKQIPRINLLIVANKTHILSLYKTKARAELSIVIQSFIKL